MLKTLPNNLRGHKMILTKTMTKKSITFRAMFSIQQWNLELVVANLVYFVMIITGVLFWTFVWCFAISSAAFPDLWHYITLLFTALAIIITFLFTFYPKSILTVFSKIIIACIFTFFPRYSCWIANDCCKPFTFFMYFAQRSSGLSAPLNAHMIGVHIGFCAHVIHISHYPGSHHVCCHYLFLSLQWWEVSDTTYKFPPTEKKLLTVQQQLFLPCANISR